MNFKKAKTKDFYLKTTEVENLFINEFMSDAPGDFVKVYIFALLYAQHQKEISHQVLAKQLRLDEKTVSNAWDYWEKLGVVRKVPNGERGLISYDIEFVDLREKMYGSSESKTSESPKENEQKPSMPLSDNRLKDVYGFAESLTGELLSANEMKEIAYWINDLGASHEVVKTALRYCYEIGKSNINYVAKVVEDWNERGLQTADDCEAFIDQHQERNERYKKVLSTLGMYRQPTEPEKKLMKVWFDEWHFSPDRVLEACGETTGTTNPSVKYVGKILEAWHNEAVNEGRDVNQRFKVSQQTLKQYYEYLREKAEREQRERKEDLYKKLPGARDIDNSIRQLSFTMSQKLLSGSREEMEKIKAQMKELEKERAILLTENNFRVDYTEIKHSCELCKDTGVKEDGGRCTCVEERMKEAELWQERKNN